MSKRSEHYAKFIVSKSSQPHVQKRGKYIDAKFFWWSYSANQEDLNQKSTQLSFLKKPIKPKCATAANFNYVCDLFPCCSSIFFISL